MERWYEFFLKHDNQTIQINKRCIVKSSVNDWPFILPIRGYPLIELFANSERCNILAWKVKNARKRTRYRPFNSPYRSIYFIACNDIVAIFSRRQEYRVPNFSGDQCHRHRRTISIGNIATVLVFIARIRVDSGISMLSVIQSMRHCPYRSVTPSTDKQYRSIGLLGGSFPANVLSFPLDPVAD